MSDEIVELLQRNELRESVMETMRKLWNNAGFLYDNPDEHMKEYLEKNRDISLWEEAWWQAECGDEVHEIQQAFSKFVVQRVGRPYTLTLEELIEAFFALGRPGENHFREFEQFTSDDCNNLYTIFLNYVTNHILSHRCSAPFPICMVTNRDESELLLQGFLLGFQHVKGEKWEPRDIDGIGSAEETTIWDKNGVGVRLLRGADVTEERPGGKRLYHLLAVIEGEVSMFALKVLQNEVSRILPTAIRSADLLHAEGFGAEHKVIRKIDPAITLIYEREIGGLPWGDEKLIEDARPLIRQYLDAYYSDLGGKKDSINRRIRNAVCLLTESDKQTNNAIGLALSITAIEALLGEKVQALAKTLAERIGALLEPNRSQRGKAVEFVKNLYRDRSDALHGRYVEKETKARVHARQLAAAVLSAVISRRDFRRRSGYEIETPKRLLADLDMSFASGEPTGLEEYNVRDLWKDSTPGERDSGS